MKRFFLALMLTVVLSLVPVGGVFAADDTMSVTASGEYVSFVNAPDSEALGTVIAGSTTWAAGSAPSTGPWPLDPADCTFTVTNSSTVSTNTTVGSSDWTGTGTDWTSTDDGVNGTDIFAMWAGAEGCTNEAAMVVVKTGAAETLKVGQDALTNYKWEFKFEAPSVMADGNEKTGTITLTMTTV